MNEHPRLVGVLAFISLVSGAAVLSSLTGIDFGVLWFAFSCVGVGAYLALLP